MIAVSVACVFANGSKEQAATAKYIDRLYVGVTQWPTELDPAVSMGKQTTRWLYQVYDTLLYVEDDGSLSSYLCESWSKIDDSTFEFKLKKGVTFHNGEAFTSEDVKFTFDRLINDAENYCNGNIKQVVATIKEVVCVDDYTVRFITDGPDPILFNRVASNLGVYIVPKDFVEQNAADILKTQPVGTGPYKIVDFGPETMELSYYEGYYGEKPVAENITYRRYTETAALMVALVSGEVDIAPDLDIDSAKAISSYTQDVTIYNEPYSTSHLLRLNSKKGVTANLKLRQAMSLAIDRQLLVDTLWDGYAKVPNGYNYEEFGEFYIADYPEYEYNPEKAKQLVAESGYDGTVIEYKMVKGYYEMGNEAAEAIVAMWKEVGINAQVIYVESINPKKTNNVSNWSNGLRFSDPLGGLWTLWGEGTTVETNLMTAEQIAVFNELGHKILSESNVELRKAYYRQMLEYWDEQVIGILLYCPNHIWAVNNKFSWSRVPGRGINFRADHLSLN